MILIGGSWVWNYGVSCFVNGVHRNRAALSQMKYKGNECKSLVSVHGLSYIFLVAHLSHA
jgi:hypothetical protein